MKPTPYTVTFFTLLRYAGRTIATGVSALLLLIIAAFPAAAASLGFIGIAANGTHSLGLKSDGTVVEWGYDNALHSPAMPAGLSGVTAIAAGEYHSLALKSDGTVVGWRQNTYHQSDVPSGLNEVVAIAAGGFNSLALTRA